MHFLLTKKLKYFIAVMETKCLIKASEDLFITRSPLGKTINELETILGEKLFLREHGQYQPTLFAQEFHEHVLPLYQKLIDLEDYLLNSRNSRHINVILDSNFPDNLSDIIHSSLKKTNFLFNFSRKILSQDVLENIEPGPDTLYITHKQLVIEHEIQMQQTISSSLLLITSGEFKSNPKGLTDVPLLLRSNISEINIGQLTAQCEKKLGFIPKIRYVNDSVFDNLLMAGKGQGMMMLPLKTCELINIDRGNTLLLNDLRIKVNYYYDKKVKHKKEIINIINHINTLL